MSAGPLSSRYRTAFVTGASTGLGLAFSHMLLQEGVQVWGTARDPGRLPACVGFHPVRLDLADGERAEAAFREAERAAGGFDLVINNAGFGVFGAFAPTEFDAWEEQFRVMLVNTARLAHLGLRGLLLRQRGALVNVSSLAGEFSLPYQPVYNAVKAGLSALSESLMYEVKGTGVIVIDFRPGDYRTDFEGSVRRPDQPGLDPLNAGRMARAWTAFERMMRSGPPPVHAAESLKRALRAGCSRTVRTGRPFQAVVAPLLARFGSLALKRRIQESYFGL
ncbi:SDR family NAD(P)-dependent oxidoreductase [Oleiharenicola lentus]|jgi:short-subunit dehydrogenase|uniref:SDR family NAD(P)-dependent oxidoreductase n=1 Tax=Oleiharenicola lentus TaxID=2508720 RepID=A0A4Q1C4K3_9BACT|nr:SDR family NAD(P)-dependent oxidoreductase [Oleiharenicola lentus]RXK53223.1 SDR family NAD(P)-dependent oxidoreductase [Oleiharenicola lentus]